MAAPLDLEAYRREFLKRAAEAWDDLMLQRGEAGMEDATVYLDVSVKTVNSVLAVHTGAIRPPENEPQPQSSRWERLRDAV